MGDNMGDIMKDTMGDLPSKEALLCDKASNVNHQHTYSVQSPTWQMRQRQNSVWSALGVEDMDQTGAVEMRLEASGARSSGP